MRKQQFPIVCCVAHVRGPRRVACATGLARGRGRRAPCADRRRHNPAGLVKDRVWPGGSAMKTTVVGAVCLGLVAGACLAGMGNRVVCLDADPPKIEWLNSGRRPGADAGLRHRLRGHRTRRTVAQRPCLKPAHRPMGLAGSIGHHQDSAQSDHVRPANGGRCRLGWPRSEKI